MRDFLTGAEKVKRIMGGTVYLCRHCGMSHERYSAAKNCCKKGSGYNKAKANFEARYNEITGGE